VHQAARDFSGGRRRRRKRQRRDLNVGETRKRHQQSNLVHVEKRERHLIEIRRILIEVFSDRGVRRMSQIISLDRVPHAKEERAARFQHSEGFAGGPGFVGHEHQSELTDDCVERSSRTASQ